MSRITLIFLLLFTSCNKKLELQSDLKQKISIGNTQVKKVLFLSFCSVSTNFLPVYGKNINEKDLPNLAKFFNSSINFTNAYTDRSWSNSRRFLFEKNWLETYKNQNPNLFPIQEWKYQDGKIFFERFPAKDDLSAEYNEYYNDERLDLPNKTFDKVISEIEKRSPELGFNVWMLHFKLMHYPYLTEHFLKNSELIKNTFTKEEFKLINLYLNNPERYPEKKSFFQATFGRESFKKLYFNKNKQYLSYVTDLESVKKWKNSKNYESDLSILKKAYALRLKELDHLIGNFLDYYKKIEKDTALVISGDHGESLNEHNYLTHGEIPYDEVLHFFFSIHFPNQKDKIIADQQVSQKMTTRLVEKLVLKNLNEDNILEAPILKKEKFPLISTSCSGDIVSLRFKNQWKFIYYKAEDRFELFNLEKDPNELVDVSIENLALAEKYKLELSEIKPKVFGRNGCI
jgi:hypothetical protein